MPHRRPRHLAKLRASVLALAAVLACAAPALAQHKTDGSSKESAAKESASKKGESESPAQVALAAAREKYRDGQWPEAIEKYGRALELAKKAGDARTQILAGLELGNLHWEKGEHRKASKRVGAAYKLAKEHDQVHLLGRLLLTIGHLEAARGDFSQAEKTFKLCQKMAARGRDDVFGALCHMNYGLVRRIQGESDISEKAFRKDVATVQSAGTPLATAVALAKTAELHQRRGDHARTLDLLRKARDTYRKAGSTPSRLRTELQIARVLQEKGDWDAARELLHSAAPKLRAMKHTAGRVRASRLLGDDAAHRGEPAVAASHYERSLRLARSVASPQMIARGHLALCELGSQTKPSRESFTHCRKAIARFEKLGVVELSARARAELASMLHRTGDYRKARRHYVEVIETLEKKVAASERDSKNIAIHRANLCQVLHALESGEALERCRAATTALYEGGGLEGTTSTERRMIAATHYALAAASLRADESADALEQFLRAAKIFGSTTPPTARRAADAHLRAGMIYAASNTKKTHRRAESEFREGLDILGDADQNDDRVARLRLDLRSQLVQTLAAREKWKAVSDQLDILIPEAVAQGKPRKAAWAYTVLARADLKRGNRTRAIASLEKALPLAKEAGDDDLVELVEQNLEGLRGKGAKEKSSDDAEKSTDDDARK